MVIFYILIVVLALCGIKFNKTKFYNDYICKDQCNAIKGIFILVVFMRHVVPYVTKAGYEMSTSLDKAFSFINGQIGQLLVVMFLFYSGFGVMTSIRKKTVSYINDIPRKRVLTTFINFDIAVTLFLLMDFALDIHVDTEQYFLARLAWDSVGNSNWYIFVIMLCYIITYVCFKINIHRGEAYAAVLLMVVVIVLFVVKGSWWYNTILCYPAGMYYSMYKDKIEIVIKQRYVIVLLNLLLFFCILHILNFMLPSIVCAYTYNIESIIFALLIICFTMKVKIGNKVLFWLGANLFPLYIYQRLPMVFMREAIGVEWLVANPYMYCVICLLVTVMITMLYRFWKITL